MKYQYKIISKYFSEIDDLWHVTYKKWPEGECFCIATKHKATYEENPSVKDLE